MDDMSDENGNGDMAEDGEGARSKGWISWFTTLEGHDYMVEVDEEYIKDPSNLYGLQQSLGKDKFKQCIKMILASNGPTDEDL